MEVGAVGNDGKRVILGKTSTLVKDHVAGNPGGASEAATTSPRRVPRASRRLLSRLARGLLTAGALVAARPGQVPEPSWVQTHIFTELWSGPDQSAISFRIVLRWSYFTVVAPRTGSRLYVWNSYSGNNACIDASAVGPVDPPSAEALARTLSRWITNDLPTTLWAGRDSGEVPLGQIPRSSAFKILGLTDSRLRVRDPRT